MPVTSRGMERARLFRIDQAVEAVFKPDDLDAGVVGGLDDGTDDGVQAGGVTSPGEDTNFLSVAMIRDAKRTRRSPRERLCRV